MSVINNYRRSIIERQEGISNTRMIGAARFADESLLCISKIKNTCVASSRDVGWRSILLDHVEGSGTCEVHETHRTRDLTIVVATNGEHKIEVFKSGHWRPAIYQRGAAGLTASGDTTRLRWQSSTGSSFRTAHLYLPERFIVEAADVLGRAGHCITNNPFSSLVFRDDVVFSTVVALLRAMSQGLPDLYAEQAAVWIASHLVCTTFSSNVKDVGRSGAITDLRLARVIEYMSANLGQQITLAQMACEASVSPFHFIRLFRKAVGMSPHAYMVELRLTAAHRLLNTTDLPVKNVAAKCGYSPATAFTTAFKKRFGYSPTAMHSQHRAQ